MRFHAVASDYDGTLAHDGVAGPEALEALRQLRKSGRRSILVTGRLLRDLQEAFPDLSLFDAVVAENGAVLYDPTSRDTRSLAEPAAAAFVEALRAKNVTPLEVGDVIVATWHPHEETVLQTIRELGLDLTVIFNKGAVMVLPTNVNKATGLEAQAAAMGLSMHNIAGIGDAENDLAFLARCEASAATANALPSVKEACDLVTDREHGRGVAEFIDRIIMDELSGVESVERRHRIALGKERDGASVDISAACSGVLLAGTSGGGKTKLVTGFIERLSALGYEYCVVDPEGDYTGLESSLPLGDATNAPSLDALADVVASQKSMTVSLLAVAQPDRPAFAHRLFDRIVELQARYGRPHWLIVDEAHHVLPAQSEALAPVELSGSTFLITTKPELVSSKVFESIEVVIAVGDDPSGTIAKAREIIGAAEPAAVAPIDHAHTGTAVVWKRADPARVLTVETVPARVEGRRHARKYAEGELAPEKSFFFTGPEGRQHLRAQNLMIFVQLADGVDAETWLYHRMRNDYSNWMRDSIGDDDLAGIVESSENGTSLGDRESRDAVIAAVRERYTAPG